MALYDYQPIDLNGKSVLITGGTTGIGRSTAQRLVAAGANVLIFGRHEPELQDALHDIKESGDSKVHGLTADQSKPEDIHRIFQYADTHLGGVDILINNAALAAGSVLESDYAMWQEVINTNLLGYMACARYALERMQKKGDGHIVNVGSMSAKVREAGSDVYVATKSGIRGFTDAISKQVTEKGIRVTLIEPGLVGTDMTTENTPVEEQPQKQAEGTMLKAEEIAECIYYTLIQPKRCVVALVQIRPVKQAI